MKIKINRENLPKHPKIKYAKKGATLSEKEAKSIEDMSVEDIIQWCKENSNV